jgi:hypothetical protein
MARLKLPFEKRRHAVVVTLPGHLIQRIDTIQTTCNRSQLYESLLKKGMHHEEFCIKNRDSDELLPKKDVGK